MAMDGFSHFCQHRHIFIFPKPQFDKWGNFTGLVNFNLFGEYHPPASFSLYPAHFCYGRGVTIAAPIAMWHLIKTVFRNHRANWHRFKQNIITTFWFVLWIKWHDFPQTSVVI